MAADINSFYLSKSEPNQSCLLALRDIILSLDKEISETVKYGMLCFCYGKKALCYLWTDKKTDEPYILLVEGKRLDHHALETGDRSRMKILRVDPNQDLQLNTIISILNQAIDLYRNRTISMK